MGWLPLAVLLTIVWGSNAINRPVYKVVLTQKGYTQFLQYDVETPSLKEFTFCTWFRVYDLAGDQSIFTYVASGNNRVLRLWLDSGGRLLKLSINGKSASTPVDVTKDVWRHLCLSYQSDYGAWAIYMDSKLLSCETTQSLNGYVLPGGGSVIVGYGTTESGIPSGLEGEMFGANMLLASTIERNHTVAHNYVNQKNVFSKNKVKDNEKDNQYIILSDLQTDEIHNNFEKTPTPFLNKTKSFIKISTPHTSVDHKVGSDIAFSSAQTFDLSDDKEFLNFPVTDNIITTSEKTSLDFWNLVNEAGKEGKFKANKKEKLNYEQSGSSTKDLAMISEFETPPPPPLHGTHSNTFNDKFQTSPVPKSFYNIDHDINGHTKKYLSKKLTNVRFDVETPPPIQNDKKVYGQWTSSKFAGSVLNYLKSINFYNRDQKAPATLPLPKTSDSYPYASDFRINKLRPPVQYQRRSFIDHKIRLHKRGIDKPPEINVKILEDDYRKNILKVHAETQPKKVEVTNRGESHKVMEHRLYRNSDSSIQHLSGESLDSVDTPKPFSTRAVTKKKIKVSSDFDAYKNNKLMTILPFLKSLEYFVEDSQNTGSQLKEQVVRSSSDIYSKSLSNANKWHNVKSYSNDFTPRRINLDSNEGSSDIDHNIAQANKRNPSLRLKYKHESRKLVPTDDETSILKGRELAMRVSNHSNPHHESVSIIKYNHGYLPSSEKKRKHKEKGKSATKTGSKQKRVNGKNRFNKQVKLGNALNERHVIGFNEEQKKKSFVGGDEKVPDINRYRSDIDNDSSSVPPSLSPNVCTTTEFGSRKLYIQSDSSIIISHIDSPLRKKNAAIEFIQQNYKSCSLESSMFENSYLLFIDWSKTPVRLFGGAYPKKTTDLCGFF